MNDADVLGLTLDVILDESEFLFNLLEIERRLIGIGTNYFEYINELLLIAMIDLFQPFIFFKQASILCIFSTFFSIEINFIIKSDCFLYILELVFVLLFVMDSLHTGRLFSAFVVLIYLTMQSVVLLVKLIHYR